MVPSAWIFYQLWNLDNPWHLLPIATHVLSIFGNLATRCIWITDPLRVQDFTQSWQKEQVFLQKTNGLLWKLWAIYGRFTYWNSDLSEAKPSILPLVEYHVATGSEDRALRPRLLPIDARPMQRCPVKGEFHQPKLGSHGGYIPWLVMSLVGWLHV